MKKTNLAKAMGNDLQTYSKGDKSLQDDIAIIKDCKIEETVNGLINIIGTNSTPLENGELTLYVVQKDGNIVEVPSTLNTLKNNKNRVQITLDPKNITNAFLDGTLGKAKGGKNLYLSFDNPNSNENSPDYLDYDTNTNYTNFHYRKKSSGLSTGGIIAIIIPSVLVLFAVAALIFL